MKTLNLILVSFLLVISSCNGQHRDKTENLVSVADPTRALNDSLYRPKFQYKVNKKLDEKGNIVSYDSTYTYSYSLKNGNGFSIQSHRLLNNFNQPFGNSFSDAFNFRHVAPFMNDSLFKSPFNDNYFEKQMEENQKMMMDLFQQWNQTKKATPGTNYLPPGSKTI